MVEEITTNYNDGDFASIKIESYEKSVIISARYRSPNNNNNNNDNLMNILKLICQSFKNSPIWVGGDLNLPDIDWKTNTISSHQYTKKLNEDFLNIFEEAKLTQVVHFNTRKNACLDLLLTNRPIFVDNCLPQPGFGDYDTSILADILCHPQKIKPTQRTIPCWNRADIDSLKEAIKS